mgnify:CR=1 FL=1
MKTLSSRLVVRQWSIAEEFDCKSESFVVSQRVITLFGKVRDSDEGIIDGFTFQLKFKLGDVPSYEATLLDEHLFVQVSFNQKEMNRLELQLSQQQVTLSLSILLRFEEKFHFELPENKSCEIISFHKTVMKCA